MVTVTLVTVTFGDRDKCREVMGVFLGVAFSLFSLILNNGG